MKKAFILHVLRLSDKFLFFLFMDICYIWGYEELLIQYLGDKGKKIIEIETNK